MYSVQKIDRLYVLNYNDQINLNDSRYKIQLYPNQVNFISSRPNKLSGRPGKGWEKNKGYKNGEREAYLCYLKEKCVYIN